MSAHEDGITYCDRPWGMIICFKEWLPRIFAQSMHAIKNVENPTTNAIVLSVSDDMPAKYAKFKNRSRQMQ
jgi:hypothetical protein